MANARSPERPLILLTCPPGETQLCQAMQQALTGAISGPAQVRIVRPGAAIGADGDLRIVLHLDSRQAHGLEGHLEWQVGRNGPRRTGPKVQLDVMDATLSPLMYAQFAAGLLRADTEIQEVLGPSPSRN